MARPRGSDLPAFPTPSQFHSSQQAVSQSRPAGPARTQTANSNTHGQPAPSSAHPAADAAYRSDPRYDGRPHSTQPHTTSQPKPQPGQGRHASGGYDLRHSTDNLAHSMRHASLNSSHGSVAPSIVSSHYSQHSQQQQQQRAPIVGIAPPNARAAPANFHGQAFGIAPETTREPPYDKVLWNLFCQVDTDGSGAISPKELSGALINGNFTPFDIQTVQLMVRMFDEDRNGTISFQEFTKLWSYLLEWKQLFARFDNDASGSISFIEFQDALAAFGYRLSTEFVQFLFRKHSRTKEMTFDLFVQACITLRSFTEVFKAFDTDQDGVITIGFEDFLRVLIKNRS